MKECKALIKGLQAGIPAPLLSLGPSFMDGVLQGGLALGEIHEIAPATPRDLGAATGFGLGLCTLAGQGTVVWVQQDFAALEGGAVHGAGCALFGLDPARLLLVRTACPKDTLFAMEEALKTRGVAGVIGELAEEGRAADLTATRRLTLAAQKGGALALLLRHRHQPSPSAATTRWQIAAVRGLNDGFGGLGRTAFSVALIKNRRGACGTWVLQWDHHDRQFTPALPVGVAAPPLHRPRYATVGAG